MNQKKKIVHIVEAFGGGVYNFLVDLLNDTIDYYDITVIYAKRPQTPKNFIDDFDKRIKFIDSKNLTREIGIKDLKALFEVKKILKEEKPDVVHCHSSKAGIIGRFAVNTKKIRTFYTPHGYSFLKEDDSKLKRFIYKFIEKLGTMNHSTTIACSKGEYEEALKLTKRATYVNNGINTKEIDKVLGEYKKIKDTNCLKICTVGRIGFQKNPKLFNQIAESFQDIEFTWIGEGELKELLTSKNIKVTGWLKREEVLKEIVDNDIFILPSLWEGLPIALLEAMYLGKLCIVSNVIGNRDVIQNEVNGFMCESLDEYRSIIGKIKDRKYALEKICNNSKREVLKKYNVKKMSAEYLNLYNNL